MAYATTYQNFVGQIAIPNLSSDRPDGQLVTTLIERIEPNWLDTFFGVPTAINVQDQLDNSTNDTPYKEIVDGATYVDLNGDTQVWVGLVNAKKFNPIANYIYCEYLKEKEIPLTNISGVKQANENGIRGDLSMKFARVWNEMVKFNFSLHDYLVSIKGTDATFDSEYIGFKYDPYRMPYYRYDLMPNQLLFVEQNQFGI
jgi:hypothetical protein